MSYVTLCKGGSAAPIYITNKYSLPYGSVAESTPWGETGERKRTAPESQREQELLQFGLHKYVGCVPMQRCTRDILIGVTSGSHACQYNVSLACTNCKAAKLSDLVGRRVDIR